MEEHFVNMTVDGDVRLVRVIIVDGETYVRLEDAISDRQEFHSIEDTMAKYKGNPLMDIDV